LWVTTPKSHAEEPFLLDGLDAELPVIRAQVVLGTDIHVRKNAGNGVDFVVQVFRWGLHELQRERPRLRIGRVIRTVKPLAWLASQKDGLLSGGQNQVPHIFRGLDLLSVGQQTHRSPPCS